MTSNVVKGQENLIDIDEPSFSKRNQSPSLPKAVVIDSAVIGTLCPGGNS